MAESLFFASAAQILHPENRTYFKNTQNFDPHADPQRGKLCVYMADNVGMVLSRYFLCKIHYCLEKKPSPHNVQIMPTAIKSCVSAAF